MFLILKQKLKKYLKSINKISYLFIYIDIYFLTVE